VDSTGTGEAGINDAPSSARNRLRVEFSFGPFQSGWMQAGYAVAQPAG
jgi:hypothetical protein